jgi:hypothetical protein
LLAELEMSKKKRAEIGEHVDAQAKGKKVTGSKIDKNTPEGRDLDVRASKANVDQGLFKAPAWSRSDLN